ncbi:hypothetical protein Anas_08539 [Armadillidium nasatum]|uniref:Wolframin n=1 Tax=Armadillidium nasatum TaxID=96803 RepID=A0A5N5SM00_9CRUS|nr:hypothetical protein Anas_08539 [Armadillidium nasatum]
MVAITSSSSSSTNGSHDATPPIYVCHDSKAEIYSQKKITRKQWSVQGEPRTLLKRLRSQLAEDGCAESQLSMAKTLLEHSEDLNYEENCHQAVFWLTQASFQGSLEATELLRKCFDDGTGICEQNYQDVKRCLEMDQQEKLAVVATKNLFTSLSEGNDFVTERRVLAKFYEICKIDCHENLNSKISSGDKCEIKSYLQDKFGSRRLSESSIISAGLEFIKGEIPSAVRIQSSILPFNEDEENLFWKRYVSLLQEFILTSIESNLAQKFSIFSKTPVAFCFSLILTLSLFFLYSFSFSKFYIVSTYCLWLVCFFVMSYSSITIMVRRKNQRIFCVWGQVFQEFNSELDIDVATRRYKYKCIHYYAAYFSELA